VERQTLYTISLWMQILPNGRGHCQGHVTFLNFGSLIIPLERAKRQSM